jgi:cation:H+ antiporter
MTPLTANVLLLVFGIVILYFGAEWLVRGAARLASSLGVSPIVVGLSVVAMGTSAPELAVSVLAAIGGTPDIALGNVMGSNLANIGLILGLTAMVRPLAVAGRVVMREAPLMVLITVSLFAFLWDGAISRIDGVILLGILAGYLIFVFRSAEEETPEILGEYERIVEEGQASGTGIRLVDIFLVVAGTAGLVGAGWAIVESARFVAEAAGIPELMISLSVIAIGTSLPELATSMVAALKNEADIAVGNVIGSNVFNLTAILGTTGVVHPLEVADSIVWQELPAVLILSLLLLPVSRSGYQIRRWEGAILLLVYLGLMAWLFMSGAM